MYRINYTGRPTLLSADEVVHKIASEQNVNVRLIIQNIELAEERFVAPAIGAPMYEHLIATKNQKVTSTNRESLLALLNDSNQGETLTEADLPEGTYINAIEFVTEPGLLALWERYLWRLAAEAVDFMCTMPTWLRHTATGQESNNPRVIGGDNSGSVAGTQKDVEFKMNVQREQRIGPLIAQMQSWICTNQNASMLGLDLYTGCVDCNSSAEKPRNMGGFIVDAYGDKNYGCSDCGRKRCRCDGGGDAW